MKTKDRKGTLALRLSLYILSGMTVIFLSAFGFNYTYSKRLVLKNVEETARNLTLSTVNKIEGILTGVEKTPRYLAVSLERQREYSQAGIMQITNDALAANPDIYGIAVAFEPYVFHRKALYCPYVYRGKDGFIAVNIEDIYNYLHWDWYQIPKELGKPVWSEPYYDEGGRIIMSTYSVPFYGVIGNGRKLAGVATSDISLDWLLDIVSRISIYKSGYAFLISRNGVFVSHPDRRLIMNESVFSIAESVNDPELRRIGRDMIKGGSGFVPMKSYFTGKKSWMYYAPIHSTGWSVGLIIPEDELFADIVTLSNRVLIIGITGFVFMLLIVLFFSGRITGPLRTLARKSIEISKGNLDVQLPVPKSRDEVGELALSFENMRKALKEYIANLAETTAAKERIESELKIAHTIQMSFLPKRFPPFPENVEFDLFAMLEPAKEVGGDFYDFFLLDNDHLFFSIGDVSGKGVPAALFMAVTKTLVKGIAKQGSAPSEILEKVNYELYRDNDSMMFVTVFCGLLNFRTGELLFTNAGHNPPLIVYSGDRAEWLRIPNGLVLGISERPEYLTEKAYLKKGDMLLMYTDGVTEAMNNSKELYSDEGLLQTVGSCGISGPADIVKHIVQSVREFAGDEPQADDITLFALRFAGKEDDNA